MYTMYVEQSQVTNMVAMATEIDQSQPFVYESEILSRGVYHQYLR